MELLILLLLVDLLLPLFPVPYVIVLALVSSMTYSRRIFLL